jgi:hypothetical protein
MSQLTGCQVFLKFENLQYTASFKERGACNKLAQLTPEERSRGVIAMSAGNHAQGVAYHAHRLGVRAVIVMPRFTPGVKVERTRGFGAEVVLHGDTLDAARAHARELAQQQGLVFVHPYDDEAIVAGQGTVALEMLREQPDLDTLVIAGRRRRPDRRHGHGGQGDPARHRDRGRADRALCRHGQRHQGHEPAAGHEHDRRGHRGGHAGRGHREAIVRQRSTTWCWSTKATSSRPS